MIPPNELEMIGNLPFRVALLDHPYSSYPTLPENCALFSVDAKSAAGLIPHRNRNGISKNWPQR